MKSRYVVLSLSLVLALALAVPALGGPTNPIASISATVKQTANKALKKANTAQSTANSALSAASTAQSTADSADKTATAAQKTATTAQSTANSALTAAKTAQTTADAAKTAAAAAQATANSKFGNTVSNFSSTIGPNGASGFALALCPAGSQVTGGGFELSGVGANEVVPTFDSSYGDAWLVNLERIPGGAGSWSVRALAVCAQP
jgi:cytoskeletal protein RodZ